VIFDPFGDFDSQGYLRNVLGSKDILEVKSLEYASFQRNIDRAMSALAAIEFIEYKHVLDIHKTLFRAVYPWAGQDRSVTAPGINITKAGYSAMFAQSQYIRRVTDYALDQARDLNIMREQPGYVMGSLAHAHPFLDGNGRTMMVLHTEMAYRAGISIDWVKTDKMAYLQALTMELDDPRNGYLDSYLKPFVNGVIDSSTCAKGDRQQLTSVLKSLKGLGSMVTKTDIEPPNLD
jgi:cell filamentation protein